ncbi:hypothetical protein [Salinibacterium sp.]|uniref:hypothetical protein n=1 Tax=Salinibacterium sp. TaxID=1915057 RepID=UPI00286B2E70|nr:hypothetical protein [Salinibacterium sp.]
MTDTELFARLRQMWTDLDPMPDDLVDSILVALATEGLAVEYVMLTMLDTVPALAGVRGTSESQTLEFTDGTLRMLLRVNSTGDGERRVDGWLTPASAMTVRLTQAHDEVTASISPEGRFEFEHIPTGRTRLWLEVDAIGAGGASHGFTTAEFDL